MKDNTGQDSIVDDKVEACCWKGELETWRSGSFEMLWAHPLNNRLLLQMTKDGVAGIQDSR